MKRDELIDFKLYLITDRKLVTRHLSLVTAVEEALKGGVKALQLREKDLGTRELLDMAYKMRELTDKYGAKLFINDRVDIALSVEADGVHLGQKSIPPHAVRKAVNASRITHHASRFLIGVSAHSIEEAKQAEKEGADFITLGPVYKTPSKLKYGQPLGVDIIRKTKAEISIPVFAIGGLKQDRIKEVMDAGADGIALISGILGAENIKEKTREFLELLK
ncbi:MAG: thiamine phosphate synthase [Thermodesulfovibrionales bacterium]|nr:thiamine phosphate synthase [Thermodesulfovibrionales bacterium]MDP3047919.1 thiamine phosphate synthase [Thermodesulfovibrionales bacterium]